MTRPGRRCRTAAGNVTMMEKLTLTMSKELTLTKTERRRQKKARCRRAAGQTSRQG